jgi:hypothetical protein
VGLSWKRWVFPTDYEWADLIDDQDKLRIIADPTSPYAINGAMALGRAMDDLIITAATATSLTGEDGTTSTAFPAAQTAGTTAGGLTVAKLREAMQLLIAPLALNSMTIYLARLRQLAWISPTSPSWLMDVSKPSWALTSSTANVLLSLARIARQFAGRNRAFTLASGMISM